MPHCILEYSDNLVEKPDFSKLLAEIHKTMVETGLFKIDDIKSRIIKHNIYRIGDGHLDKVFVTLNVEILSGRSDEVKTKISESLIPLLIKFFHKTISQKNCSITVQISDINRASYQKYVSENN
ncbi:5-carboxymethyl-2-hydroxymuconate Delta-isomerase [Calditrichota bacterium]